MHSANVPVTVALVALVVAVVGQTVILFGDFRPTNHPQASGGMITAAALTRAGAIEVPAGP